MEDDCTEGEEKMGEEVIQTLYIGKRSVSQHEMDEEATLGWAGGGSNLSLRSNAHRKRLIHPEKMIVSYSNKIFNEYT